MPYLVHILELTELVVLELERLSVSIVNLDVLSLFDFSADHLLKLFAAGDSA
jgi:hypothetical protein